MTAAAGIAQRCAPRHERRGGRARDCTGGCFVYKRRTSSIWKIKDIFHDKKNAAQNEYPTLGELWRIAELGLGISGEQLFAPVDENRV